MGHFHPTHFYDSANPSSIPSGVLAGVYVNSYPWTASQINRMRGVFGISEKREAFYAQWARCIAIEPGAGEPEDAVPFLQYRHHLGHTDGLVYVNRSNWAEVRRLVEAHDLPHAWWVATLDGTTRVDDELCTQAWGGPDAPYDRSITHGPMHFTHPHEFTAKG